MNGRLSAVVLSGSVAVLATIAASAVPSQPDLEAAPANCTRPAYLVVAIDDLDRSRSAPYGDALRRTQIVARHGGTYTLSGVPAKVLEGDWPAGRSLVVERFPCLEAIERFWYSDEYQKEVKPLREGSGRYLVVAYEEWQPRTARQDTR